MTRRIYLAGPMTGYPDHNYPAFRAAAADLRGQGHYVYSPHERIVQAEEGEDRVGTVELRHAFADYCRFICLEADTIVLLPGWEKSRGALAEHQLGLNCGLEALLYHDPVDMVDVLPKDSKCPPMKPSHLIAGKSLGDGTYEAVPVYPSLVSRGQPAAMGVTQYPGFPNGGGSVVYSGAVEPSPLHGMNELTRPVELVPGADFSRASIDTHQDGIDDERIDRAAKAMWDRLGMDWTWEEAIVSDDCKTYVKWTREDARVALAAAKETRT